MPSCVLVTHGPVADALAKAAQSVMGDISGVHALSVSPLSLETILEKLEALANSPEAQDGLLILATLRGGSCWNAACKIAQRHPHVRVISGVNLPMLLSFLTKRDRLSFPQLVETVCRDGVRGITAFPEETPTSR
ncbi:MAG: PTS sugar transporter subunit IIA [candidate division KSB1 bacterium]|nr:PTS sugar transporter subunit IIA [candidate division KSB1 bacterium]MDZ7339229.1 PTS sugar transporter subunit IIA [candidate division KSB1 bacterium]